MSANLSPSRITDHRMDRSSSPPPAVSRFSLRNVLVIVVPAAILALGLQWYLYQRAERTEPQVPPETFLQLNLVAPTKLDDGFLDEDTDLVADAPKDAKNQIDPETLVFAVLGQEVDEERPIYADFVKHLESATGKKIELTVPDSVNEQNEDLRDGKLHLVALNTGSVSAAVNKGGVVPFCVMADGSGKFGYEMQIIVPASSAIKTPADLKGASIGFVSPYSHSGFKAPIVTLWDKFKLLPGRDYQASNLGSQDVVARGVAKGELKAGAVASDLLKRLIASGKVEEKSIRTIYTSGSFPSACYGYAHQLKPELAAKIKSAFFDFDWKGTALEKQYAAAGYSKFVPISYKGEWAPVRALDEQAAQLVKTELASKSGK
jgi:phosphonate transport system substrate-binding protein